MTLFSRAFGLAAPRFRAWLAFLVLLASATSALAQTCALPGWDGPVTASGVINAYHGGSGSPAAGATSISVASATGLRTNTRALRAGDLILIMQMQDSVTGANAGLHEYAQIVAISGTTLSLNRPLTNAYTQAMSTSSVRNWQVIWVPQYSSATISGTVSADRWTSSTTTGVVSGGVVALDVTGSLALNGTVTVAGAGFRGAMGLSGTATVTATVTTANITFNPASVSTVNGGQKGEGTQGTPPVVFVGTAAGATYTTLLGQGYALGAGGQAAIGNAGGGANDGWPTGGNGTSTNSLNSGGGGGANAGAGGQGGNSWNNGNTATAVLNQGTNTNIGNVAGGKGGNAQSNLATRLVLGGGGGAGAANNATANIVTTWPPTATSTAANGASGAATSSGAPGGGVVLIRAGSFSATAGVIDASGYRSYNKSLVGDTDSAGGGGGGGSVYLVAGSGTAAGLTVNASGGAGGSSNYYNHGPGGGGGGGYVLTNMTGGTLNVAGGANGTDGCCGGTAGNGSPKAWNSAPGNAGTALTTGGAAAGVQGGASCLPVIAVTKSTTTPSITTTSGATASYSINLSNSGGAASNVFMIDATLPPGWSYTSAIAPTFNYSPAPPPAANSSAAGAETTSASVPGALPVNTLTTVNTGTAVSLRAAGTAPGVTPTTGNNTVTFGSFYLPQNSSVTVSFVATIPNTATVGVYHNPAGVIFLDPTRTTAVRMVSPASNVSANRNSIGYSANTTYASGGTSTVGGSNYSGLAAGPTTDDVTLLPDLSVTKSMNTPTFTLGASSLSYVIISRNNGRPVADQVYANTQATAQSATAIMSTPLSMTDTLPTGMTLTAITNSAPAIWACSANATSTTFSCSASSAIYPLAASSNLVSVTATVTVGSTACPGPRVNTVTFTISPLGDAVPGNNIGTVTTPINCNTNLTVTKTDGRTTVAAGATTSYTLTFANLGPAAADGALLTDVPSAGLTCSVASCTPGGAGVCPVAGQWPNLLGGGLTLPSFASGSTLTFIASCNVTATGQ
ncbi:MAG: DUF11 domain-containing protein [Polaromonas sp.]|uniref:beta strand repeat-containing protein n=1 Tax=Polaromonas sp. TaxID=1869339 RepID=UPI0025E3519A|nr:hypothetical protein [Polaromonas sp.]MBI2729007.1 DUF11 domain-containing protein [Polaromonas sp.]